MARQADDANVMAEIFAAELRADAEILRQLVDFRLHIQIAESVGVFAAFGRQAIEIARRGELDRLEVQLGRKAADDDGEMIRRAGGGAERQNLRFQHLQQPVVS